MTGAEKRFQRGNEATRTVPPPFGTVVHPLQIDGKTVSDDDEVSPIGSRAVAHLAEPPHARKLSEKCPAERHPASDVIHMRLVRSVPTRVPTMAPPRRGPGHPKV
jgi:hypothetical protein